MGTVEKTAVKKMRIGDRLIQAGYITKRQLDISLKEQKRVKEPLGQILINLGFIDEEKLSRTIAEELGVEFVKIKDIDLDVGLVNEIDEVFARQHMFIPIRKEESGIITVAMADPSNIFTIDAIQERFGKSINILAATNEDILKTIGTVFKANDDEQDGTGKADDPELIGFSAVDKVDEIIDKAIARQSTDIHIEPEEKLLRVRYRMDGILQQGESLPNETTSSVLTRFKLISAMDITERRRPQDGRFSRMKGKQRVDFRVSTMPTAYGENIVIRLLDRGSVNLNLRSLGVDEDSVEKVSKIVNLSHGMLLVSGPTGSGKTTTLYSMILMIDSLARKVITVEDPIEYKLPLIRQSQVDHEIGYTFAEGLRTILRQDPDVILVGEIRDPETGDIAVKSSMTGHMVFSSIHTNSAIASIRRLNDLGVEKYLISSTLTAVLAQRLVRVICPKCKEPYPATKAERNWLGIDGKEVNLYRGIGCGACHNTGYSGRTVVFELFVMDDDFVDLLSRDCSDKDVTDLAKEKGMSFMLDDGKKKALNGTTSIAEVLRVCNDTEL